MNAIEELLLGHVRACREAGKEYARRIDALEALISKLSQRPASGPAMVMWSEEENDLLRKHYVLLGARACADLLPHRSYGSVRRQVSRLGLQRMPSMVKTFCDQCSARVTSGQIASCQSKFCPKGKLLG